MKLLVLLLLVVGCKDPSTPTPGEEGETCAIGTHVLKACRGALTCKMQPYTPVPVTSAVRTPESPSDVGGNCGGVAGFHCTEGLACDMTPEQASASDGMGDCARESKCQR